jgi:hypothetical protein
LQLLPILENDNLRRWTITVAVPLLEQKLKQMEH